MAVKKSRKARKSPAVRARKAAKRVARRASRKGKMPAGLKAYWAKKNKKSAVRAKTPKRRRTSRKAKVRSMRRKSRKSRARRSTGRIHPKGTLHIQGPHEWNARRLVRANPKRRAPKARKSRRTKRNAGASMSSMTLMGGLKGFQANLKDTFMGGGVKGFAAAAAGAGGAVLAGTIVDRVTRPALAMVLPASVMTNPIVARVLGAANYYLAGWALAKYVPGVGSRTRRAMLTGATVAALVEAFKPGLVRQMASKAPVVGGLFDYALEGCADGVSDYVAFALNGSTGNRNGGSVEYDSDGVDSNGDGFDDNAMNGVADYSSDGVADYASVADSQY